jgi:hypothetical protein
MLEDLWYTINEILYLFYRSVFCFFFVVYSYAH